MQKLIYHLQINRMEFNLDILKSILIEESGFASSESDIMNPHFDQKYIKFGYTSTTRREVYHVWHIDISKYLERVSKVREDKINEILA